MLFSPQNLYELLNAQGGDWLIVLRPPPDAKPRRFARLLKRLLRTWGVKCIDAREVPHAENQKESPVTPSNPCR